MAGIVQHRLNIVNMSAAQRRYIDDIGRLMVRWGLPRTTGRVYGYLLLRPDPATLDEIARDLDVAKSGGSVATRQLIATGLARSFGEGKTRRLRYDALYDLSAIVAARAAQTRVFIEGLREGAKVAAAPAVRKKITAMTAALEGAFTAAPTLALRAQRRKAP